MCGVLLLLSLYCYQLYSPLSSPFLFFGRSCNNNRWSILNTRKVAAMPVVSNLMGVWHQQQSMVNTQYAQGSINIYAPSQ
jgi:hypothetical protein